MIPSAAGRVNLLMLQVWIVVVSGQMVRVEVVRIPNVKADCAGA